MPLQFVDSERGHKMLLYNGHTHSREKISGEKGIWKCFLYHKWRCTGRIHTIGDEIVKSTENNHVSDSADAEVRRAIKKMKVLAEQSGSTTHQIIAKVSEDLSSSAAVRLPQVSAMKRTIQRKKEKTKGIPAISNSLLQLVIPQEYTLTSSGQLFLMYDSGPSEDRILVFTTARNLDYMLECEHWYGDGTFSTAPNMFSHIYTIHGRQIFKYHSNSICNSAE
ncbi:unnamed protein product [Psylliodes chrysocephalus]|uniref:FLYWCH-type domain-containing protein n=1 Tax=Psylliodes chrysocephalus TaxID=3402493 RepID=A0A9P0CYY1_9CUCU|nr:unnamed protein product [Psylliodes chrysocephala]